MGLLFKSSKLLNIILDSLEDQEGGAMYISCDVSNGGPVEPETGYVPNNPLFGLALDSPQQECAASCVGCLSCQGNTVLPISSLTSSDFDCGSCFDPTVGVLDGTAQIQHHNDTTNTTPTGNHLAASQTNGVGVDGGSGDSGGGITGNCSYWSTDEMASTFPGLPPLDIDPLPSLFPFSPCGASYNFTTNPHQASLSYTVHPHQMLVSPSSHQHHHQHNSHHHHHHHQHQQPQPQQQQQQLPLPLPLPHHQQHQQHSQIPQQQQQHPHHHHHHHHNHGQQQATHGTNALHNAATQAQTCYYDPTSSAAAVAATTASGGACGQSAAASTHPAAAMYPSMSVNVSMNMTMHGYGADGNALPMQCSQMNWTPPNSSTAAAAVNVLYPPLLSPTHYPASATYSFTADFRAPTLQTGANSTNASGNNSSTLSVALPTLTDALVDKDSPLPSPNSSAALTATRNYYGSGAQIGQSYTPPNRSPIYNSPTITGGSGGGAGSGDISGSISDSLTGALGYEDDEDSNEEGSDMKPNLCRLCGKTYARPSTLKTHLRTHSGERPYRCPDCNKSFSQAANLTAHVRTHTGQKPFRCPICDRRFSQSSSVTTHMRTHSGERPYRCSSCKKSFSDSSTLTKHLRIHSGEKPYQCKLCLLRFSQSGNLNRHMRVHGTTSNNNNNNNNNNNGSNSNNNLIT